MKYLPEILRKRLAFIAIREYAALSWCYYEHDVSPISDEQFDELCEWLRQEYANIKQWDINNYLDEAALAAGTGYHLTTKICGQTLDYAHNLLKEAKQRQQLVAAGAPTAGKLSVRKPAPADDEDDDLEALLGR